MNNCNNCDTHEYCSEIRRCFKDAVMNGEQDNEVTDLEELAEPGEIKRRKMKSNVKITDLHRDLLKASLNI